MIEATFIKRAESRRTASVTESWNRLETWYRSHAPEIMETLRPGALESEITAFEKRTGLTLPDDVRASLRIHDGQQDWVSPGAIVGVPFDRLERIAGSLEFWRSLHRDQQLSDVDCEFDEECTSYPEDAIRLQWCNPNWVPIGNWDGNCYGIDLDPGPNGVLGQVINFGRDEQQKFVLALSWGQYLEDIADELEAGNLVVTRDAKGEVVSFGPPGRDEQFPNFYGAWSHAKLPEQFQRALPAERAEVIPGDVVEAQTAAEAAARVEAFVSAMHEYELHWLRVRPIHELGYRLVIESETGHRLEGCGGAPLEKMEMKRHIDSAVRGYREILKKHCVDRKRTMDGALVQMFPPHYDPSRGRVAEVRLTSPGQIVVSMEPVDGQTTRFHLKHVDGAWLIDVKDVTMDNVTFTQVSVLFGFH